MGDRVAYADLVRRHAVRYRQVAYRFVGRRDVAEDIVQDAFLKLWTSPPVWDVSKNARFTTWFYRLVVNRCIDHLRHNRQMVPMLDFDIYADPATPPETALAEKEQMVQVETAFRALPERMQTSLNLGFYDDIPNAEAAKIMGVSLKAFQSLLMRAKTALRDGVAQMQTAPKLERREKNASQR